jgi:hypothetical protein
MVEPVTAALGGAFGLLGRFTAILNLLAKFRVDGSPENDALNLSTRIDQQKILFKQWGN